jgi:hypothetical protein
MAEPGIERVGEITVLLPVETSTALLVEAERRGIPRESLIAKLHELKRSWLANLAKVARTSLDKGEELDALAKLPTLAEPRQDIKITERLRP